MNIQLNEITMNVKDNAMVAAFRLKVQSTTPIVRTEIITTSVTDSKYPVNIAVTDNDEMLPQTDLPKKETALTGVQQTATIAQVSNSLDTIVKRQIEGTTLPTNLSKVNLDKRLTTLIAARIDSLGPTTVARFTGATHQSHTDSVTKGVQFTQTLLPSKQCTACKISAHHKYYSKF